jgi:hypothetical protein
MRNIRPLASLLPVLALASCVTSSVETSDGRPAPPMPRAAPRTPSEAPITDVAAVFGPKPLDTNGNLLPDTIQVELYLFAKPYPTPTFRPGTFAISIYPMGKAGSPDRPAPGPLRSWTVTGDALLAARAEALAGPCYRANLSLLDDGRTDELGVTSVDVVVRFTPEGDGRTIAMTGVRTISLKGSADLFQSGPVEESNERPGGAKLRETRIEPAASP